MAAGRLSTNGRKHRIGLLKKAQGTLCCYCDCQMVEIKRVEGQTPPKDSMTLEHLLRVEDGGSHDLDNLALACYECNTKRGAIDWFTYKCYKQGELWAA